MADYDEGAEPQAVSSYIVKTIEELRAQYVPVMVYVTASSKQCALAGGSRLLFWVVGDGSRTLFYQTMGYVAILHNREFKLTRVYGASNTFVEGGRVKFVAAVSGAVVDLGPLEHGSMNSGDANFEEVRKSLLKGRCEDGDFVTTELCRANKAGKLDKLFNVGDSWL